MKKILCVLLMVLLAFMSALVVGAANENEVPSIYVYEEGGNRMELTLTGDTECAMHVIFADGGDISAQASYAWQEENLVVFLNGEKLGAFAVEGEQLILIEDDPPIDKGEGMINDVDYVLLARQFAAYIQSGEAPEELINSFITMGEEMQQMKEDGYTLKERLLQLIAPENLLTTCTALFLVVGAIILFLLKRKQKDNELDIGDILNAVGAIKEKQESETKSADDRSITSQKTQSEILDRLQKMEQTLAAMKLGSEGAAAVAKMVKDVFLNSRTLDADGKQLMIRNYNEAIGLLDGGKDEKSNEITAE